MRGSDFIFDSVQHMYYKCHKVNFKRRGLYIDSPDWIEIKTATIYSKNDDHKCVQYTTTVALNYEKIKCNLERASNIKPFLNKYIWEGINYQSKLYAWKRFKKEPPTIAPNVLYIKEKEILPVYISNHNFKIQIILLIISNKGNKGWHYLAVKKLSILLHKKLQIIRVILIV